MARAFTRHGGHKRLKPVRRRVHLNRALSKLGILTRSLANVAILEGRVSVNGRVVRDPATPIDPDLARIELAGAEVSAAPWRTLLVNKPRGVVTTRRDPDGRQTIYDLIGEPANGLVPVGRLDLATSGLLLLTSDTEFAASIVDPASGVPRVYVVTVRGRVTEQDLARLSVGVTEGGERLRAESALLRKASSRESHLTIELREGKNREVRRLMQAIGHEVTRLKRVRLGALDLGDLAPGGWRDVSAGEVHRAFPALAEHGSGKPHAQPAKPRRGRAAPRAGAPAPGHTQRPPKAKPRGL